MKTLAPVVLFCYKRLDTLKQTVESLQQNYLAGESELYIFSDGANNEQDRPAILAIRDYLKTITGFKGVTIFESPENKGLANSIITGVTAVINKYEKVILSIS